VLKFTVSWTLALLFRRVYAPSARTYPAAEPHNSSSTAFVDCITQDANPNGSSRDHLETEFSLAAASGGGVLRVQQRWPEPGQRLKPLAGSQDKRS
jgi:hypothetical protein